MIKKKKKINRIKVDAADIEAATTGLSIDHDKYGLKVEEFVRATGKGKEEAPIGKEKPPKKEAVPAVAKSPAGSGAKEAPQKPEPSEDATGEESDESIEVKVDSDSDDDDEDEGETAQAGTVVGDAGEDENTKAGAEEDDGEGRSDESDDEGPSLFPNTNVDASVQRTLTSTSSLTPSSSRVVAGDEEEQEEEESADQTQGQKSGKYISAADRRAMKKASQLGVSVEEIQKRKEEVQQTQKQQPQKQQQQQQQSGQKGKPAEPPAQTQAPRGKKGKIRKMKEKYADQDEEDREMMMEILGSAKQSTKQLQEQQRLKDKEEKARIVKEQQLRKQQKQGQKGQQQKQKQPEANEESAAGAAEDEAEPLPQEQEQEQAEGESEGTQPQSKGRAEARANKKREEEELRQLMAEENILDEDEMATLTVLDTLTGRPLPEDTLLFAIPVCAPYAALINYKYKVKLTPGTAKKGKAVQTSINLFSHLDEASQREKDLMKSIPDPELITAMMGKVKISTPNLEKVKAAAKKKTK